jgi:hypothetical protein
MAVAAVIIGVDSCHHVCVGRARWHQEFKELLAAGGRDGRGVPLRVATSQWPAGPKKALLSPVVVGTIDQFLPAGVSSRHVSLRHLGLGCLAAEPAGEAVGDHQVGRAEVTDRGVAEAEQARVQAAAQQVQHVLDAGLAVGRQAHR